jgi:hypothetical protein
MRVTQLASALLQPWLIQKRRADGMGSLHQAQRVGPHMCRTYGVSETGRLVHLDWHVCPAHNGQNQIDVNAVAGNKQNRTVEGTEPYLGLSDGVPMLKS